MLRQDAARTRLTWVLFGIAACSLLWELAHIASWLPVVTSDARVFYLPWYDELMKVGRLRGIAGEYANYTPPTLYLFSIASLFHSIARPVVLLKLINLPFVLISATLAYSIALELRQDKQRAAAVAAVVLFLPEVWQNSFHWGQYDILYTTFLLGAAYALLKKRVPLAMVCLGSAMAFKLQAVFVAPALLALLITREVTLPWIALIPAAYATWMLPAAAAGRSWKQLLFIYREQSNLFAPLSVDAPNIHFLVQPYIANGEPLKQACHVADALAVLAALWIVWKYITSWRPRPQNTAAEDLILLLTVSQLVVPYLLPHMHERYYFAGNVFAALLLAGKPKFLIPVILFQAANLATYHLYFKYDAVGLTVHQLIFPVVAATLAVMILCWYFQALRRRSAPSGVPTMAEAVAL